MSSQNDNDYFDDQNLAFLPAAHPLMSKLQDALKKTLEVNHEKVHLKLKEKEGKLKKLEREREDTAVRLYEVQQSLAEMHLNLEQTHQNFNLVEKLRVDAEKKLAILNQEHEAKKKQVERLDRNVIKAQDDLSKITRTLLELEEYNKKVRSDIAVTRGTTYRVEENIAQQEQEKKKQDFLLDHLTEQKKKFSEQISIIEAQLLSQRDETKAAKDILREAFVEMESIIASKKNLLERWQKSLLEMQRRDKALQVARDALKAQYESSVQVTAEIGGVNNEIKKEAAMSEVYGANLNRLRLEERHLDEERSKVDHEIEKLNAQIKILQQSLQVTESSIQTVEKDNRKIEDQMKIIEDNIMKIHTQATKIFEQIIDKINEHKTLEKTSANLLKQAQNVEHHMAEKEVEKENTENELARIHLDMLNTTNQLEMLKGRKREISEERKKKEETVATYELEIRQGHDINEKKQTEVGKLNKVHDQIVNSSADTSKGPIEAHKNHLLNEIKELTEKLQRLEKDWIKKQTSFVKHQQRLEEVAEETSEMKTKKAILEQKRARLQGVHEKHEKDIRDIKIGLKNLQTEMNKLNDGLSKNHSMETKLKSENFHVQSEIVEKLKELEKVNVKLEVDIDSLKEEKAQLLNNIIESEKQMLLWERKILIEKEIQEALDPNIGQSEIKLLKQDLHRMELRLDEIRKRQEKTIHEMERQIYKRDTIELKYTKSDEEEEVRGSKELKPRITRQIESLRSALAQTTKNNKDYDKKLKQLQAAINERNQEINDVQANTETAEEDLNGTMTELVQKKVDRIKGVYDIVKTQTTYKAYDAIAAHRFKLEAPENILRERYEKQKDMNIQLIEVLRDVAETNPQYTEVMRSLLRL